MNNIFVKIIELKYIIILLPCRLGRLFFHFSYIIPGLKYQLPALPVSLQLWFVDLFCYLMEILGLNEVFHVTHLLSKGSFRKLSKDEISELKKIFQGSIDYSVIWIDDHSRIGLRSLAKAYVLFNTINYSESIDFPTLVHETVHIWQYQNLGAMYLGRALIAQRLNDPYGFGGSEQLYNDMIKGKKFLSYNFEQQGSIFEFLIRFKINNISHPFFYPILTFYQKQLLQFHK